MSVVFRNGPDVRRTHRGRSIHWSIDGVPVPEEDAMRRMRHEDALRRGEEGERLNK